VAPLWSQSRGFKSYSVKEGLAQSNVMDIAEDRFGNLWLATLGGVSKFDGMTFENLDKQDGLPSNQVFCLAFDQAGDLWIGTNIGVSRYNGRQFTNYPQWVNKILVDQDQRIWLSNTAGGLFMLDRNGTIQGLDFGASSDEVIVSDMVMDDTDIWISTFEHGLFKSSRQDPKVIQVSLPDNLRGEEISALYMDVNNQLWLGASNGLYRTNNQNFDLINPLSSNVSDVIYSINEDYEGTIWLGTSVGALIYHDGSVTTVQAKEGLTDNVIYKIHRDREGTLWFGTFGGGFFKSLGNLFTNVGKAHGISYDYISSIAEGRDHYWLGSYGGGIYKFNPRQSQKIEPPLTSAQGLSNNFIFSLVEDQRGNLWAATAWGLSRYDGNLFRNYYLEDGLPSNQVFDVVVGLDGKIYGGTAQGLVVISADGNRINTYRHPSNDQHNRIRTMTAAANGTILLGTQAGIKVFDGESIKDFFNVDSLRNVAVSALYQEPGDDGVWCSLVDEGILYHNPRTNDTRYYNEGNGLSSNIVFSLAKDASGALWVGTSKGLDKVTIDNQQHIIDVRSFGAEEGFFGIETNTNAILTDSNGAIWFGTVAGAFICQPEKDTRNTLEPMTLMTGIQLFSQKYYWQGDSSSSTWSKVPQTLNLKHNQNHLTFQYAGVSLKNPLKVRYQYMLENFDRDWQPITTRNEAVYTNLPPGHYTFIVKAANNDGVWNSNPVNYAVYIAPPFWQTWWFYTLAAIAVLIIGRLYYNFRIQKKLKALLQVQQIKNQETMRVRKRVGEDFHDQVGNQLASITVLVQLIQAKISNSNPEINELLNKLGQFTKTLFTGTRDFIWSIDPKSDNVNEMLIYIRDFGEELFEYSDIDFHVDTNDSFNTKTMLPVGWSRHVVFIFKEALTNSLKHAHCENVYLNFNVSDHNFVFELRDDGKGLNGYEESDAVGMGMRNMQARADKINSKISISTAESGGTIITLAGKLPQNEG